MRILTLLGLLIFSNATFAKDAFYEVPVLKNEIKIMSYNVQNLFDAEHDDGKIDFEFLPKSSPFKKDCDTDKLLSFDLVPKPFSLCTETDWTPAKIAAKYEQIEYAISLQGPNPDILVLAEVENPAVVSGLAKVLGYEGFYMTNSPDERGIDLAVLFNEEKLEPVNFVEKEVEGLDSSTRNASAATFRLKKELGGDILAVFPAHWPSQGNPVNHRIVAAETVKALINSESKKYSSAGGQYHAVVLGDFNITDEDSPNAIETVMLDKSWSMKFQDVHAMAVKQKNPYIGKMPQGTFYYGTDKAWNHFDHILVSSTLTDGRGLDADVDSYRINAPLEISKVIDSGERIPFRFNHMSANKKFIGYSDHYAIHVKLAF